MFKGLGADNAQVAAVSGFRSESRVFEIRPDTLVFS